MMAFFILNSLFLLNRIYYEYCSYYMKIKVGITGGIGSGKSTVARIIKDSGYLILDADSIAKKIMLTNETVIQAIKVAFGQESYTANKLNKDFLAASVFTSVENVRKINSIVHPPTITKINELMDKEFTNKDIVFVESALIYESEMDEILDHVLLVTSPEELRIERIIKRDSTSESKVLQRMKYQMPELEKENLSDFVIKNESSIEDLENKTKFFLMLFETMT